MRILKEIGNFILLLLNVWRLIPHDKYVHIVSAYFGFEILQLFYSDVIASIIILVVAALVEIGQKVFKAGHFSVWDWVASISTVIFYWVLKIASI